MGRLIYDTCFLIDFQRERLHGGSRCATFLEKHGLSDACVSVITLGEFAEGFTSTPKDRAFIDWVVDSFWLLDVDSGIARIYASITRELRMTGQLIGTNDLWIAATSLAHNADLVTKNLGEFSRIENLKTLEY